MCGRFSLALSSEEIKNYFAAEGELELIPRYNIAPSQPILVVRQLENQPCEFAILRWGLIPHWIKEENLNSAGWINARIESAAEKPAFKQAFKYRRCLIVANGFYEWKSLGRGKQPYYIHKKDKSPLVFAGIWEHWQDKAGRVIESCAILTTQANKALKDLHDRMPIMLEKNQFMPWLDPYNHDVANLRALITAQDLKNMESYPVGQEVNKASYDEVSCIKPININPV